MYYEEIHTEALEIIGWPFEQQLEKFERLERKIVDHLEKAISKTYECGPSEASEAFWREEKHYLQEDRSTILGLMRDLELCPFISTFPSHRYIYNAFIAGYHKDYADYLLTPAAMVENQLWHINDTP